MKTNTSPRKRLVRTVKLDLFEDPANGEFGLTHHNTQEAASGDDGFNAFWDGRGIFHDVFEHAHEHTKHFSGEAAMNIGGEMAAMGAYWYYVESLWIARRNFEHTIHSNSTLMIGGTIDMVQEAIENGEFRFGYALVSNVPAQKPLTDEYIEDVIGEYMAKVSTFETGKGIHESEREEITECATAFAQSVTHERVANLHRWGYNEARKLVPEQNGYNAEVLNEFIRFWSKYCKANPAEELANSYRGITFRLYHDENKRLSWTARFEAKFGAEPLLIRSDSLGDHGGDHYVHRFN